MMCRKLWLLGLSLPVLLGVFMMAQGTAAHAQTSVAVLGVEELLRESLAAQSIQKQFKTRRDKFLEGLSKEEQALREEEKNLVAQKEKLSQEEFARKVKAFEEKLTETRKKAQENKLKLDETVSKAMAGLRSHIYKIAESLADERKYDLIITRQNVVIGAKAIDITDEALKRLNEAVKDIKLE